MEKKEKKTKWTNEGGRRKSSIGDPVDDDTTRDVSTSLSWLSLIEGEVRAWREAHEKAWTRERDRLTATSGWAYQERRINKKELKLKPVSLVLTRQLRKEYERERERE